MTVAKEEVQEVLNQAFVAQNAQDVVAAELESLKAQILPPGYVEQKQALLEEYESRVANLLTDEQRQQIKDLEAEFEGRTNAAKLNYDALIDIARNCVLELKETVAGHNLQCVYSKGARKIDPDKLEAFAMSLPSKMKKIFAGVSVVNGDIRKIWDEIEPGIISLAQDLIKLVEPGKPSTSIRAYNEKLVKK